MDSHAVRSRYAAPSVDPSLTRIREDVKVDSQTRFAIVTDAQADDPITKTLAKGVIPDEHRPLLDLIKSVVPPHGRILDLGGHIGTFSLAAAALGFRVLAVEASPQNAALLQASIDRNKFTNLTLIHAAVSDRPGRLEFCPIGPYGHVATPGTHFAKVSVPALAVDDLLAELGWDTLDFIKMDIEGSEVAGLKGMTRTLSRPDAPPLFVESNGHTLAFFDKSPDDLKRTLERFGYRNYLIERGRLAPVKVGDLQPTTVSDYLALKQIPVALKSWRADRGLTTDEVVSRVLASALSPNADERRYIAKSLVSAPRGLRAHATVRHVVEGLQRDTEESVRAAASKIEIEPTTNGWRGWLRNLVG